MVTRSGKTQHPTNARPWPHKPCHLDDNPQPMQRRLLPFGAVLSTDSTLNAMTLQRHSLQRTVGSGITSRCNDCSRPLQSLQRIHGAET